MICHVFFSVSIERGFRGGKVEVCGSQESSTTTVNNRYARERASPGQSLLMLMSLLKSILVRFLYSESGWESLFQLFYAHTVLRKRGRMCQGFRRIQDVEEKCNNWNESYLSVNTRAIWKVLITVDLLETVRATILKIDSFSIHVTKKIKCVNLMISQRQI